MNSNSSPDQGGGSAYCPTSRSIWWCTGARTRASATALRPTRRRTSTSPRDHAVNRSISRGHAMMLCRRPCRKDNAKNDGGGKRNFCLAQHTLHLRLVLKIGISDLVATGTTRAAGSGVQTNIDPPGTIAKARSITLRIVQSDWRSTHHGC
jgi:hypothetical protein